MRGGEVQIGAERDDAGGVYPGLAVVVVAFYLGEVYGFGDAWGLEHFLQPALQVGVVADLADVAFEMAVIGQVEADGGGEEADVGFGYFAAEQIVVGVEGFFDFI